MCGHDSGHEFVMSSKVRILHGHEDKTIQHATFGDKASTVNENWTE